MPRYSIYPESLMAPNKFSPYLSVSFRRGVESRDPIFPASGLQLSFERPDCDQEIFVERIPARDVQSSESGLCTVSLPKDDMPKYAVPKGREDTVGDVVVKLHAWKGERHLGAWEMGRLSGLDAYKVVG
ncbi:hypothetical protein UCDDA912_g04260 [Diaporthe ampelina]|uniref:Uncharacterized protein n=1 Tax=Diaporthe ampelina TaxID=1214573 RepID=A0A0G2I7H2_9PEZI|nr:hypothetical protein UCDDA912_g04260 [Diaporthe ampelina]